MTVNPKKSELSSKIVSQESVQEEKPTNIGSSKEITNLKSQSTNAAFTFTNYKSGWSVSLSQWFWIDLIILAIAITSVYFMQGSQFCFLSYCRTGGGSMIDSVMPVVSMVTLPIAIGVAGYAVASLAGVSILPAVAIAVSLWLLVQATIR